MIFFTGLFTRDKIPVPVHSPRLVSQAHPHSHSHTPSHSHPHTLTLAHGDSHTRSPTTTCTHTSSHVVCSSLLCCSWSVFEGREGASGQTSHSGQGVCGRLRDEEKEKVQQECLSKAGIESVESASFVLREYGEAEPGIKRVSSGIGRIKVANVPRTRIERTSGDRQTDRQTDRQAGRQAGRQARRHTDTQTHW